MIALANQVVTRCVDHMVHAGDQPICGDVDAAALCGSMVEPSPEHGVPIEPLLESLFRDWIPRSFTTIGPGYVAFIPGGGTYPAALADFIANTTNRYTGVWQAAPALLQLQANAPPLLLYWLAFPPSTPPLLTTAR